MCDFFKRPYTQLDIDEIILITEAAFEKIKELESENKTLNLKLDFFTEALEQQNKIIKRQEREKKSQLVKFKEVNQN